MRVAVRHQEREVARRETDPRGRLFGARERDLVGGGEPGATNGPRLRVYDLRLPAEAEREFDDGEHSPPA